MPNYSYLRSRKRFNAIDRQRTAEKLLELRKALDQEIPVRTVDRTLLLATWNLRDFDSNKFGHGPRLQESYFYIAEIITRFDLIAVQEVNADIEPLKRLMKILGKSWEYIVTDATAGRSGNSERMAFIYDSNKVTFERVAGEIVLPQSKLIQDKKQFARTPFMVAFRCGWFKFNLCTVHIYYGSDHGEKLTRRIEEIRSLSSFLGDRAEKEQENYILLGDFNIVSPKHETMKALLDQGFEVPEQIRKPSNIGRTKYYDQIAFKTQLNELRLGDSEKNAGVFEFFNTVFTDKEFDTYYNKMNAEIRDYIKPDRPRKEFQKKRYYKVWKTFQISDHLPMWVELKIDFSEDYLGLLAKGY
ncbi:MAG: endonuclease/exonuclease/phosphatase family protein [Flammeovirgaceae bacterium]